MKQNWFPLTQAYLRSNAAKSVHSNVYNICSSLVTCYHTSNTRTCRVLVNGAQVGYDRRLFTGMTRKCYIKNWNNHVKTLRNRMFRIVGCKLYLQFCRGARRRYFQRFIISHGNAFLITLYREASYLKRVY